MSGHCQNNHSVTLLQYGQTDILNVEIIIYIVFIFSLKIKQQHLYPLAIITIDKNINYIRSILKYTLISDFFIV